MSVHNEQTHDVDVVNTHEEYTEVHTEVGHGDGHGAAEQGLAASLGLNAQLFAFQLLNFAVVAAIIWFLILKPLTDKLEERKKIIDESLDNAKEVETKLTMSEKKYQERIDEAKIEANKIIEKTHAENKKMADDMKERAQDEVEKLVAQAKKNIGAEKEAMIEAVKKESADMIVAALEKILNEKVDSDNDKKIIEDSINSLKK